MRDLADAKARGEKWPMITAYDALTAASSTRPGIPVMLVGDSAAMVVYGHDSTIPVTVDELLPLVAASSAARRAPWSSPTCRSGRTSPRPQQALETAARFMKESGAHAVKLEGGARVLPQVEAAGRAGIPVMAHLGLTPQSVQRVRRLPRAGSRRGRRDRSCATRRRMQAAGAFSVVLEVVPAELAARVTRSLSIPTIGIGAGAGTDAQVSSGRTWPASPRAAREVREALRRRRPVLSGAVRQWADEVVGGVYPGPEHEYR